MYAEERQQLLIERLRTERRLQVTGAAEDFDVTTETIRRDLAQLEQQGLVRRVHGGAVPADSLTAAEVAVGERHRVAAAEKERIARAAIGHLPGPGGSVLLDAGTTLGRLARSLPHDAALTVVTNGAYNAVHLADHAALNIELLGGRVRRTTQAVVGPATLRSLADLRVDVAFVGANGIACDFGLTTPDADEAAVKEAMVAAGSRVIVLADATKLRRQALHRFARLAEIDVIITDASASPDDVATLEAHDVEVVLA